MVDSYFRAVICDVCKNRIKLITDDVLHFLCTSCGATKEAKDEDSLIYEEHGGSEFSIYISSLEDMHLDPVNPTKNVKCPKCGHGKAKYAECGRNLNIIYACIACGHKFVTLAR
jgi:DNA-directed RNA polymerase subunit M/transcription elongation factor TFIIS